MDRYDPVVYRLKESKIFYKNSGKPRKVPYFYDYVCSKAILPKDYLWLEFGTGAGLSTAYILRHAPGILYGFDWFKGLPEEWVFSDFLTHPVGEFSVTDVNIHIQQLIARYSNLIVVPGLFEETIPAFVKEYTKPCAFIHIDCDLYSSTKTVFTWLKNQIVSGTVILFDEFYNYPNYRDHEYKAFMELEIDYDFIAHVGNRYQAAVICR